MKTPIIGSTWGQLPERMTLAEAKKVQAGFAIFGKVMFERALRAMGVARG